MLNIAQMKLVLCSALVLGTNAMKRRNPLYAAAEAAAAKRRRTNKEGGYCSPSQRAPIVASFTAELYFESTKPKKDNETDSESMSTCSDSSPRKDLDWDNHSKKWVAPPEKVPVKLPTKQTELLITTISMGQKTIEDTIRHVCGDYAEYAIWCLTSSYINETGYVEDREKYGKVSFVENEHPRVVITPEKRYQTWNTAYPESFGKVGSKRTVVLKIIRTVKLQQEFEKTFAYIFSRVNRMHV